MTYDTECDPISFCKFVMENLEEKVRDNEGLPIPMIVIYTNLDDLVKITIIENYIKEQTLIIKLILPIIVLLVSYIIVKIIKKIPIIRKVVQL